LVTNEREDCEVARGDHLRVKRMGGLYTHHGIDMGDGTVVHLSGEPLRRRDARVCRSPMEEFLKEGEAEVVSHGPRRRLPDKVVATALAHLDETGYDVWRNNCEHFATYCATGRRWSRQVVLAKRALQVAAGVAAGAVIVTGSIMMATRRYRGRDTNAG